MYEEDVLCHVKINNGNVTTKPATKDIHWLFMPFGQVKDSCISRQVIDEFFKRRCFDEHCSAVNDYLNELGLYKFNTFDIVQKTCGRMNSDEMWIKFTDIDYNRVLKMQSF